MKPFTKLFLMLFILCLSIGSCKKDDDDNPSNNSDNFSEYFNCKINGEDFQIRGTTYCNSKAFHFYAEGTGGLEESYMLIRGKDCLTDKSVLMRFFGAEVFTGYMDMTEPLFADSCRPLVAQQETPDSYYYFFDKLQSGSIEVSSFSPRNGDSFGKIEGTFAFVLKDEIIDSTITVTEGEFRFQVPNSW